MMMMLMMMICSNIQVVSVTSFNGGNNLDMIPDTVVLGGTFRAFSNTSFYELLRRIKEVRDGKSSLHNTPPIKQMLC